MQGINILDAYLAFANLRVELGIALILFSIGALVIAALIGLVFGLILGAIGGLIKNFLK